MNLCEKSAMALNVYGPLMPFQKDLQYATAKETFCPTNRDFLADAV
jgi:hypothetical protein